VVTAGKYAQSLNTAHQAVGVVSDIRLVERQSRNVSETLLAVSGVHFNEDNISIRGSSGYSLFNVGSRILLMIDGVPFLTSDLGAINWDMLPLVDIERIEVVKGGGSALYGSSALGGIVNIITRSPSNRDRLQIRTTAGVYDQPYYETWRWTDRTLHFEKAELAYSRRIGPVGFRLSGQRAVTTGYTENSAGSLWNAAGRFDIRLPKSMRLDLHVAWMKNRKGYVIQWLNQNSPFEVPPFNKKDEINYETLDVYSMLTIPLSASFGFKVRVSSLISQIGNQLTTNDPGVFDPGQGYGAEVQGDWIPHVLHHVTFGAEYHRDLSGSEYFGEHHGYSLSPYIQDDWTVLSNLRVTAGFRFDYHDLVGESVDRRLSPKIGLNWAPLEKTVIRATFGSGFRAASVFEKYIRVDYSGFNIIPNPDLRAEHSWFGDIGIRQSIGSDHSVEISLFQADYWDMIEPVINFLGTVQFQNYIRARIRGLEGSADTWWWKRRIGLSAAVSWMDPMDTVHDLTLPYRPRFTGIFTGTLRWGSLSFQAEYRYASRLDEVEIDPLDPRVPLKLLGFRIQARWSPFVFQAAINNALNYQYTQIERRMGEIRNLTAGILLDWGEAAQ
jgi:outer membrane receptor for ferrienterochelin and colicins